MVSVFAQPLDRPSIEALQLERLRALVALSLESNPFQRAKLRAAGVERPPQTLREFFGSAPLTTKAELAADQAANPPYGSNLTFPLERYTRYCQTSGTTARPLRWLDTPESWAWMLDCWTRVFEAAGVGPGDRVFFPFSFGPFLGFWAAFEAAWRLGCLAIPGGGMRGEARLAAILDNGVTALCATPTYAIHLARAAAEAGVDLGCSRVRRILVAGEPGGSLESTRAAIETLWPGAEVRDHHGMTEIGPVSYECPARPGVLHVVEAAYLPEVLDPATLATAGPGSEGELVLTNLGRLGSPLLRYRTGDRVRRAAAERCACGSDELALEGGILGRIDDMVVVRGVNVYPSAVEEALRAHGGLAEFRVEIGARGDLAEMRVFAEPAPEVTDPAGWARALEGALHRALALRVPVEPVEPGALPRFEMKARRWVRL